MPLPDRLLGALKPSLRWTQSVVTRLSKGLTLGVRVLATDRSGGVVLVRHGYVPGWYLPGGGVDPGETAETAARRELIEETGFSPAGDVRLVGVFFNRAMAARDHVLLYHVDGVTPRRPFEPSREIIDLRIFPMTDLPADINGGSRRRIEEHLGNAPPALLW